jgi:hypothetical protein
MAEGQIAQRAVKEFIRRHNKSLCQQLSKYPLTAANYLAPTRQYAFLRIPLSELIGYR